MAQQSNSWARPVMLSTTASDRWRAIPAVINVPKDWDDLTPEWWLVAIGLGAVRRAPGLPRESLAPPGVIQCRPSRFSCGWATTGVVSSARLGN